MVNLVNFFQFFDRSCSIGFYTIKSIQFHYIWQINWTINFHLRAIHLFWFILACQGFQRALGQRANNVKSNVKLLELLEREIPRDRPCVSE